MRILYSIVIHLYISAIYIASHKSNKAKLWINGRKNTLNDLKEKCKDKKNIIWFHCASLGEFEQGRSLIELIKKEKPEYTILLTFFSPSGYEIRKNYPYADIISYLPADTCRNSNRFLEIVKPKFIFFVKYEYWFNYIHEAHKQHIPFYIISAILRKNQRFFKFYGFWFRKQLSKISYFFTQNEETKKLLKSIHITQCEVFGDTRFDTVSELSPLIDSKIEKFIDNKQTFIAGSTWYADEKIIASFMNEHDSKWIIAPHEIHQEHLQQLQTLFSKYGCLLYTDIFENTNFADSKVLIINTIGLLKGIYHYGKVAYIGGGFGKGIHNVLEAATFGKPIVFGPNYKHFREACDLIEKKAAFSIHNESDFSKIMNIFIQDSIFIEKASLTAKKYVEKQKGTSERIFSFVFKQ